MSSWFKRKEKGIQTATEQKKDTPKGLLKKKQAFMMPFEQQLENHLEKM